jgi:glycosyltransferase involved in cell wall biosynthesis
MRCSLSFERFGTRFPFDVIDAEFFWPDGPAAVRLGGALGVPVSIKARGSDVHLWGERPGIGTQIVEAGAARMACSRSARGSRPTWQALGMPADRIRVHHTGVDLDRFRPLDRVAAKKALGVSGPLLVSRRRSQRDKGQHLAIQALAQIPDAPSDPGR